MTTRNYSSTAIQTTLSGGVTASATSLPVTATTGFPAAPFILVLEPGTANQEAVLVTAVAGLNLTVTRGYDSTTGVSHNAGAVVQHSHIGIDFREANTHVNASTGVHGIAGAVVGTTDAQALSNKTTGAGGALVGTSDAQTLSNKTLALGSNTVSGTLAQLNTAVTDADVASLAGAETLTNKTVALGSNTVSGTKAQFDTACTDADFASLAGTETLTNKTLTSPALTTPVIGGATLTKIQKGNASVTFTAEAGPVSSAVTFGSAFSVAPEVTLASQHATTIFWATNITTTGFTLNARQYDSTARSATPVCSYIAMV